MTAMDEAVPAEAIAPAEAPDEMPAPARAELDADLGADLGAELGAELADDALEAEAGAKAPDALSDGSVSDGSLSDGSLSDSDAAEPDSVQSDAAESDAAESDPTDAPGGDDGLTDLAEDGEAPAAAGDAGSDDPAAAEEPTLHVLPARLALREAQLLLDELADSDPDAPRSFDAQAVVEISTGFALVLASLVRARSPEAAKIRLIRPSPAFVDAFSDLGLFQDLMKMEFGQ
ncbi:MAG: hypothetical protein AAFR46_05340 [Pseudomonadota bacterium]